MTAESFFTQKFRIAPLTKMPEGVKIGRYRIKDGDLAETYANFRRVHPTLLQPYWRVQGPNLLVVTETDQERLREALRETYPRGWGIRT